MATTAGGAPDVLSRPTGKMFTCWERKEGPACVPVLGSEPLEGSGSWSEVQTSHTGICCPQGVSPPHSAHLSLFEFHLVGLECSGCLKKSLSAGREGLCQPQRAEKQLGDNRTRIKVKSFIVLSFFFFSQSHQQSPRSEAGGGNLDLLLEAYWEYCSHLLCFLHYLWDFRGPGKVFPSPVSDCCEREAAFLTRWG